MCVTYNLRAQDQTWSTLWGNELKLPRLHSLKQITNPLTVKDSLIEEVAYLRKENIIKNRNYKIAY